MSPEKEFPSGRFLIDHSEKEIRDNGNKKVPALNLDDNKRVLTVTQQTKTNSDELNVFPLKTRTKLNL